MLVGKSPPYLEGAPDELFADRADLEHRNEDPDSRHWTRDLIMTTFVNPNHSHQPSTLPATKTGELGSAKRNIIRKGGGSKVGKSHNSGKSHLIDDGSTYDDPCALDEHDPNYDSEVTLSWFHRQWWWYVLCEFWKLFVIRYQKCCL